MKDLLALSETIGTFSPAAGYAADLARILGASATALFVVEAGAAPTSFDPAVVSLLEAQVRDTLQRGRNESGAWERVLRERGAPAGTWQVASGPPFDAVRIASAWHDALVFDLVRHDLASVGRAARFMTGCGLPCFVVPDGYGNRARLDRVAVAVNGSPESIRALHASLPLLAHAGHVVLMRGRRRAPLLATLAEPPLFDCEAHLERHGIRWERRRLEDPEQASGEEILAAAEAAGADLLVMGAYGRNRVAETVFGGATWHALRHTRIALFTRH